MQKFIKSTLQNQKQLSVAAQRCLFSSSAERPAEAELGKMKKLTFTAFESSVLSIMDILMPNPTVTFNQNTGLTTREYRNSRGDIFQVNSQVDQNKFWELYKISRAGETAEVKSELIESRNPSQASDEELFQALTTISSFFNRGTVVQSVDLEVANPEKTTEYFVNQGLAKGFDKNTVALNPEAPLNFRFIKEGEQKSIPNDDSLVSTIDHTVINVYRNQLDNIYKLFPDTFWGGDPRDLRAEGVQFDTRVLTSNLKKIDQLVPVNNLDWTEEEILHRIQDNDTYLPPYIAKAAITNQITRGFFDTNRTTPVASRDAFLQHIAMHVNTKYGDISYHLQNLKDQGLKLIPGPPDAYYELTEVDLGQRVLLPLLFKQVGVDAFALPYTFFNGLLKPKDANVARLEEILVKDNNWSKEQAAPIVEAYLKIQPILKAVGENVSNFNETTFRTELQNSINTASIPVSEQDFETIISLIKFNNKKVQRAQDAGSLIDFQIITFDGRNETGYLDQTFSVPITIGNEGTSGIFLEFIVRTCYDEIFELIKEDRFYTDNVTDFKSCGAFGQGNFGNLMLGQQLGIKKADAAAKAKQQQQGYAFKLPMIDNNTIRTSPLTHLNESISEIEELGQTQNLDYLKKVTSNLNEIIEEGRSRGLWN